MIPGLSCLRLGSHVAGGGWLPMIHVGDLIGGVGASAALKFRLRAVDHAKLARFEMPPNAYHQHHQCPGTRSGLRSSPPNTAGPGAGDTAVTGLGTDGLASSLAAAFSTGLQRGRLVLEAGGQSCASRRALARRYQFSCAGRICRNHLPCNRIRTPTSSPAGAAPLCTFL